MAWPFPDAPASEGPDHIRLAALTRPDPLPWYPGRDSPPETWAGTAPPMPNDATHPEAYKAWVFRYG